MADAAPALLDQLRSDWGAVQTAAKKRVTDQRTNSAASSWALWSSFCQSLGVDTNALPADPIPLLQIFAQRLRSGTLAPGRGPVKSRSVEDSVRGVGQTYAGMGAADPRLNPRGKLDFRLTSLYRAWANADPPPSRVKPLPQTLLAHVVSLAQHECTPASLAAANVLILGFFFLLRPGEYLGVPNDATDTLFRLKDVAFWVGSRGLQHHVCPVADLQAATFVTLTFTRQKTGYATKRSVMDDRDTLASAQSFV